MSVVHTDRPARRLRFWTPERVQWLAAEWANGKSAALIGDQVGLTRSAILGKVHREGLPSRRTQEVRKAVHVRRPRRSRKISSPRPPTIVPVEVTAHHCTIMELRNHSCRWPVGGPLEPARFYCGAPSADLLNDVVYCKFHSALAYRRVAA